MLIPSAIIVLGIVFLLGITVYLDRWAAEPLSVADETMFVVPPSITFSGVADALAQKGVVNPWLFSLRARQRGLQSSIQIGEYRITVGQTADDLLDRLTHGDVVTHRFLIVEGTTCLAVLERLAADDQVDFDLRGATVEDLMARLGLLGEHAEGRFFPDTYLFKRGDSASYLLVRAKAKMDEVLTEVWGNRSADIPLRSPYETLILASIIEKETAVAADRARIAGVFTRRLDIGMRLQSDPTVIYGLGNGYDGNLTKRMLKTDGPYNTYRRYGLPPTPIALPGRASIEAALHPEDGKAMYFVAKGDGTSVFSETLEEHNEAVRRYQRK